MQPMDTQTHMDTQTEAIERLQNAGYVENLSIDDDGKIVNRSHRWSPVEVVIDELLRFEGMSSPDDEAMLLAVTGPDGTRGTISLPYGPDLSGQQADAIRLLVTRHRQ